MLNHTPPPSLSIFILAGLLLTAVSHAKPSEDYPHAFDVRNDVLIAQYDSKPDPDDLHAQIALGCMLQAPELKGIEVYAVMGAYGKQGGDNPYSPEFRADKRLFDYAFGEEDVAWTNAHPKYEDATWYASAQWIFDRVKPVLLKGGRVWVAEAGQSDFTREWVEMLVLDSEISEVAIKDRVVVVQHSIWNHQNTTVEDLLYVDQYATYFGPDQFNADRADLVRVDRMVIFNGNWQFRSALTDWLEDATHPNNPNVYARDAWILADDAAKIVLENAGNTAMAEGGVDFSDTIEAIWILDYDAIYEDRQNPFKFWKAFVVNHPPEAMASEDFSNGFGLFVDGSASAGLASIEDGSAENALSSRALRLGGSAAGEPLAMLSSSLDASASVRAMIEFDYYMSGFEADDRFLVEYYNGAEWVVAGDYSISGDFEEGVVRRGERLLVEGPFPTDFNVRFRSLVNGANDLIFIDNVVISSIAPPFESVEEKAPYGNNGNPWPVPGRVQAENYDFGGLNVSYYDESGVNSGGAARKLEGVYLAQSSDIDASLNVGRIRDGEWLEYTVEVAQADSYRVDFRVASPDGRGAIALSVDGQTIGEIVDIPVTDGWQSFQTVSMEEVPLSSGRQVIRVTFPKGNLNLNWWEVVSNDPDAETGNPGLYTERGGLVIMEAENTDSTLGMWELVNPTDSRYVNDAANELHLEFTGNTISNGPPNSPLSYTFEISQSGVYQLHIRGRKRLEGARDDQCNDA